ncbi:MAG: helix-turn-helix domain-containing protein [bacterium]
MTNALNFNFKIGIKIKKIRLTKKLTQKDLSKLTGINQSHIAKIESGGNVAAATLKKLAAGLNVDISELIGGTTIIENTESIEINISDKLFATEEEIFKFNVKKTKYTLPVGKNLYNKLKKKFKNIESLYIYEYPDDKLYPYVYKGDYLFLKHINAKIIYDYDWASIKGAKKYNKKLVVVKLKNREKHLAYFEYPQHFTFPNPDYDDESGLVFIEGDEVESLRGVVIAMFAYRIFF